MSDIEKVTTKAEVDCRTCNYYCVAGIKGCARIKLCTNGSAFRPSQPIQLYKQESGMADWRIGKALAGKE